MPHIQIEYSGNLEAMLDMSALCDVLREVAVGIDAFPLAGVRVRAIRADHYAIADGNAAHGFIDLSLRLREGRSMDVKHVAIEQVFGALKSFVSEAMATQPISLSAEIRDINAALSPKHSTIRQHLEHPS